EQRPRGGGVALDERPEVPEREAVALEVGRGLDRGAALAAVDDGDVAEVVAWPEAGDLVAVDDHEGLTALHHVEPGAALALADDRFAFGEGVLLERAGQPLELARLQPRKERYAL